MPRLHCRGGSSTELFPKADWTPKSEDSPTSFFPGVPPRSASASNRSTARSIVPSGQPTTSPARSWRAICFWKMPQRGSTHFFRSDQPAGAASDGKQPITKNYGLKGTHYYFGDLVHARPVAIARLLKIDSRSLPDYGQA